MIFGPHSVAAGNVFTPLVFLSFSPYHTSTHTFLPAHNLPQAFPFIKLSSINHDHHLHSSGFSPLHKILTVNHYLRSPDFQRQVCPSQFRCFFLSFYRIKVADLDLLGSGPPSRNAKHITVLGTAAIGLPMDISFRLWECKQVPPPPLLLPHHHHPQTSYHFLSHQSSKMASGLFKSFRYFSFSFPHKGC